MRWTSRSPFGTVAQQLQRQRGEDDRFESRIHRRVEGTRRRRLVALDLGQVVPLATVTRAYLRTPTSGGVDITPQMRWLVANRRGVTLALQTVGDGVSGPLVYHAVIECIWQ